MSVKLNPIPPSDSTAAEAGPSLLRLNELGLFESITKPELWITEVLHMRARGEITLRGALFLTLYCMIETGHRSPNNFWAALSLVEVLGQVNAGQMTPDCLRKLYQDAASLHFQVFTHNIKKADELRRSVDARHAVALRTCGMTLAPLLDFYNRVYDALVPHLMR